MLYLSLLMVTKPSLLNNKGKIYKIFRYILNLKINMKRNSKDLCIEQKIDKILEILETLSTKKSSLHEDSISDEDMYKEAYNAVISVGKASTSYIQRKLGIGYSRAAKIMDMLEERGVIGPISSSNVRKVKSK